MRAYLLPWRAYAIRPYTCSVVISGHEIPCSVVLLTCKITPFARVAIWLACKTTPFSRLAILLACKTAPFAKETILLACKVPSGRMGVMDGFCNGLPGKWSVLFCFWANANNGSAGVNEHWIRIDLMTGASAHGWREAIGQQDAKCQQKWVG